ncbi:glycosyl transferase [Pedobacter sp. LMG 31464]|uniref:Glycosyl transferase n=1 Tax=Pedobacter planticolens TaxID=2679964 RepID=A0A923DX36_9SPHI|nr:glycosyltransferase family 39 protein [Pedobacter planticolens]MBB2145624.1 glycosyl transferase [Pedobacter planticolens]
MKKGTIILFIFILIKIILQYLVVNPIYELHRDEFLHLDQAKHLAWGYHSVPPVTSWLSWLILQLGNSYFWIKFFPALFGALTILVVWKTIETLKGSLYACILAATALTFSTLLRINILYQPNSLDILCWTLLYYTLIKFIQTENYKWLYYLAISFAIGFLNKYNITFCLLGLLPALILSKHPNLFLKPHFYGAILLAALLISPNLIWQFQNDFPVFKHLKELNDTQLVHVERMDFVKEQIFFFLGSIFIIIAAFVSFFTYKPHKNYQLLFWAYLFTIAIFIFLKAKAYYAIGLYPIFFAFGAIYLSELLQHGWKQYLRYVAIAIILLLFLPMLRIDLPLRSPEQYAEAAKLHKPFSEHKWEDGKTHPISQDFADMLGWKELASKTDSLYTSIADKEHVMILCDNYGEAGAINYYTKIKGLQANSFSPDYINWISLDKEIKYMIRVAEAENTDRSKEHVLFNNLLITNTIENKFAREKGTQIILLSNPKMDINAILKREIAKRKD